VSGLGRRWTIAIDPEITEKTSSLPRYNVAMQQRPAIEVSADPVKSGASVYLMGTGFTPSRTAMSHLLRPDGTEYNPIRLRINDRGELSHKIDTTMLNVGTFEVWIEDETSKTVSNRIHFTVE
jgi:hypothetical protein